MTITQLAVRRPTLVVVFFSILIFLGLQGYFSLTYELLPDISTPVFTVFTVYPGGTPNELENEVTRPVENMISSLEGVKSIQSISMENASIVTVEFNYGINIDRAVEETQRRLSSGGSVFPDGAEEPTVHKFSLNDLPVMQLGLTSSLEGVDFSRLVEESIQPEFARLKGVGQVEIHGGEKREIRINVEGKQLQHYNLSLLQISQAISRADLALPSGNVSNADREILVRLSGRIRSIRELKDLVLVTLPDGSAVKLDDVAEMYDSRKETEVLTRINGNPSLGMAISKQSDGNSVELSRQVKDKIQELEKRYAAHHLRFTIANDDSDITLEATNAVMDDLILAIILVAVIMLLFLHSIRNAVIVMIAIPVSVIATFGVMSLAGFSLNLMTLLGLSLVIGILVDDSIVVLEFVHQQMEQGMSAREAAMNKWDQIGISVTAISLVIVVVFLPLSFVTGMVGDLLRQFSIVVVSATLISLLTSFTLTTYLTSRFIKLTQLNPQNPLHWGLIGFERLILGIKNFYRQLLEVTLRHKVVTLAVVFGMVFASFALLSKGYVGSEFMASADNGQFLLKMELPRETPLKKTNLITEQVENFLARQEEVQTIYTTVGQSSGTTSLTPTPYLSEITVKLIPAAERSQPSIAIARKLKTALRNSIPGVRFSAVVIGLAGGVNAPIQIAVQGADLDTMIRYGEALVKGVKNIAGTEEVRMTVESGSPELDVEIDRDRLAALGLTLDQVALTMQNALGGKSDTKFQEGNYDYDIRVQLDAFDRKNQADLENLSFLNHWGELINLSQFAQVIERVGPSRLERKDKISTLTVEAHTMERDLGSISHDVQSMIDSLGIPQGITVNAGGNIQDQREAFSSLGKALAAAILLAYLIMVALYDNYIYPLITLLSVPVAVIGAFLALALVLENISIFSFLGIIMLVGLVVKNAILIVDFSNELKAKGVEPRAAVVEGTLERFRPILMTTLAMVIAMIPVAVAKGAGSEWKNSLAWVLIGGLSSSMLLTLIVVPVAYNMVDELSAWGRRVFKRKT